MAIEYPIFPLERILKMCSDDSVLSQTFPDHTRNYYEDYKKTLDELRLKIYPHINIGLAVNSGDVGIYTDHSGEHFDEVVRYAGILLGLNIEDVTAPDKVVDELKKNGKRWLLQPYEIFLLLHAIRFHDVGNIYGRKGHEKKIITVMHNINFVGLDDRAERKIIASIGQAHGGVISDTDSDTIGKLVVSDRHNGGDYRAQFLAAVVRLADEICEGRKRATRVPNVPKGNEVFHKYASSIDQCDLRNGRLYIKFSINKEDSTTLWGKNNKDTYLTHEVCKRLDKMELERRYCNMFLPAELQVRKFKATVIIWKHTTSDDDVMDYVTLLEESFEVSESGYPGVTRRLLDLHPKLSGDRLCKKFDTVA